MKQFEQYAPFRPKLTAEQRERVERSKNPAEEYGRIALEEAKRQLAVAENSDEAHNALPDDPDVCLRFPSIDPRGQYSAIDMKLRRRTQVIDSVLNLREESVRALVASIIANPAIDARWRELKQVARRHRVYTRAEKLCHDEAAAEALHVQVRRLEVEPVLAEVDLVVQGIEHLLGIREGDAPEETARFYRDTLRIELTAERYEAGRRVVQPDEINLHFQNFDNQILQFVFCEPENWGLTLAQLDKLADEW